MSDVYISSKNQTMSACGFWFPQLEITKLLISSLANACNIYACNMLLRAVVVSLHSETWKIFAILHILGGSTKPGAPHAYTLDQRACAPTLRTPTLALICPARALALTWASVASKPPCVGAFRTGKQQQQQHHHHTAAAAAAAASAAWAAGRSPTTPPPRL